MKTADKLAKQHGVSAPTIKRDGAIINLWLACYTQEEIAEAVGVTQQGIAKIIEEIQQDENFQFVVKPGQFSDIEDEPARLAAIAKYNQENAHHCTTRAKAWKLFFEKPHFAGVGTIWDPSCGSPTCLGVCGGAKTPRPLAPTKKKKTPRPPRASTTNAAPGQHTP